VVETPESSAEGQYIMLRMNLVKEDKLILFVHFHKCGGSSIVNILKTNYLQGYPINSNGNPKNEQRELIKYWNYDKNQLEKFVRDALSHNTKFIALEWNYFSKYTANYKDSDQNLGLNNLFNQIICFREPRRRYISILKHDEYKHNVIDYHEFKTINLIWTRKDTNQRFNINYNKDNYYVALLNGYGESHGEITMNESHLIVAKSILLKHFKAILILENPESFKLLEQFGIRNSMNSKRLKVRKSRKRLIVNEKEFKKNNILDYKLYEYAKALSSAQMKRYNNLILQRSSNFLHDFFTTNQTDTPFGYLIQSYLSLCDAINLSLLCRNIKIHPVVWHIWYNKLWKPRESLFVLKHDYKNQRERMKNRFIARRNALTLNYHDKIYIFEGFSMDIASCNITPATAHVFFKDDYHFDGHVNIRKGNHHNLPTTGSWCKGFIGANIIKNGGKRYFKLEWREILPTNRGWFEYIGYLSKDCRFVYGTFSWSIFPKKILGIFGFLIVAHSEEDVKLSKAAFSIQQYRQQVQLVYDKCLKQADAGENLWLKAQLYKFLIKHYGENTGHAIHQLQQITATDLCIRYNQILNSTVGLSRLRDNFKVVEHTKSYKYLFQPLVPKMLYFYRSIYK
jgi:hypothetical protein